MTLKPTRLRAQTDFEEAFKMDKAAFKALPKWKQEKAKKDLKIF